MVTCRSTLRDVRRRAFILVAALLVDMSATAVTAQGRQPAAILRADSFIRVARAQSRSVVFLHIGVLFDGFRQLDPEIDALIGQILHADRLAILALVFRRVEARVEPEVRRIGEVAGRLTLGEPTDARADGETLGRAAAAILAAVQEHDAVFAEGPPARRNNVRRSAALDAA
jgi:hypothetical protein